MKTSRVLPGAIVAGSVAVAAMFAAAPASAATLPAGAKITVIEQYSDQFFDVNPATAFGTAVGTVDALIDEYVTGVDVDDSGHGYATATALVFPEEADLEGPVLEAANGFGYPVGGWIYQADANTGKLSGGKAVEIGILGDDDIWADECTAIDYSKGVILAACIVWDEEWYGTLYIGEVDYDYAADYAYLEAEAVFGGEGFVNLQAIALSPIDGTLYGFGYGFSSWVIDLEGDTLEYLNETTNIVYGADFDRTGQLWLSVDTFDAIPVAAKGAPRLLDTTSWYGLSTWDFDINTDVLVDTYSTVDPYDVDIVEAITVWGVLANTGATVTPAPVVAASGVLLVGALLAAGAMVLRRRQDT